jgi:hypothetical protein
MFLMLNEIQLRSATAARPTFRYWRGPFLFFCSIKGSRTSIEKFQLKKFSNVSDRDVRRWRAFDQLLIQGVVPLMWKNSRDPRPPHTLDRSKYVDLLIYKHVMICFVALFHILQLEFFVDIDEHGPVECVM